MASEKRRQPRLDVDLGTDLLAWVETVAAATGQARAEVIRDAVQASRVQHSLHRDMVCAALLAVITAAQPDERYDPADDPRMEAPLAQLALLLGSHAAAEGILAAIETWQAQRGFGGY